jgi:putative ABC transport system permease protein
VLSDFRYALRLLIKSRTFTVIAVLTLAVGIGSATVIFSAVNAFFLKPLPFIQDPERILYFTQVDLRRGIDDIGLNYRDVQDLQERMTTLDGLWVHSDRTVVMSGGKDAERLLGTEISHDGFSLMGVQPVIGRAFTQADSQPSAPKVALLSYDLWQQRFGGSEEAIGTAVTLNSEPVTIIGVMPKGWAYPDYSDLWMPIVADDKKHVERGSYWLSGRAKMKPGVSIQQVRAEADAIMAALAKEHTATNEGIGIRFVPLREEAIQDAAESTKLLFGAVLFVFLISCLNVANLLLARSYSRSKEIALRLALGADRKRLIRQLLTESAVLGVLGGTGGLIFALWALDLMVGTIPIELPFWLRFEFDYRVFFFALLLALLSAFVFGLAPALRSTRPSLVNELKEGGRTTDDDGAETHRIRNLLVVLEVAIALILLVGATLLLKSFHNLRDVNPGFTRENVLTFRTGFPMAAGMREKDETIRDHFMELQRRLAALPGVMSAGVVDTYLARDPVSLAALRFEGSPEVSKLAEMPLADHQVATRGYFETLQIPLIVGRHFERRDVQKAPAVALVDRNFAVTHFGSPEAAIGKRFRQESARDEEKRWIEIVGVVGDVLLKPDTKHRIPAFYIPLEQAGSNFMTAVIRTHSDPAGYGELIRQEVIATNRNLPVYDVLTLEDIFIRSVWTRQFFSHLFTISAGIALFLACIGIYGVMTYNVAQRTQELGMRMALGAQPREVIALVLRRGAALVCAGLFVGLLGAYFAVQLLTGALYGVSPHDPPTFALVPLLLVSVAMLACYLPSRRITSIDPNIALRNE